MVHYVVVIGISSTYLSSENIMVLGDEILVCNAKMLQLEQIRVCQSIKRRSAQFRKTSSALHKNDISRSGARTDTVNRVRKSFQCSPVKSIHHSIKELRIPLTTYCVENFAPLLKLRA